MVQDTSLFDRENHTTSITTDHTEKNLSGQVYAMHRFIASENLPSRWPSVTVVLSYVLRERRGTQPNSARLHVEHDLSTVSTSRYIRRYDHCSAPRQQSITNNLQLVEQRLQINCPRMNLIISNQDFDFTCGTRILNSKQIRNDIPLECYVIAKIQQ
jgi:hypothetical protein